MGIYLEPVPKAVNIESSKTKRTSNSILHKEVNIFLSILPVERVFSCNQTPQGVPIPCCQKKMVFYATIAYGVKNRSLGRSKVVTER